MAGTAVLGRLTWRAATIAAVRDETATARTLVLDVPGWPGHLPGQHLDVRLTAEDGYTTQRSYSIASAPAPGRVELTVQAVADGEVSSYLAVDAAPGDAFEVRGPVGGYFVWRPDPPAAGGTPVLLVGGGSGVVPLVSMVRARAAAGSTAPFRFVYSVRSPDELIYRDELRRRERDDQGLTITYAYTRRTPPGWPDPPRRLDAALLTEAGVPPERAPACFVCGPTGFVEAVADLLVAQGHASERIRTERFGPTGG